MQKHTTPTKSLSRFAQLLDGSFPSGMFVHSFGLEPHIVCGIVNDINSLKQFLHNVVLDQYIKNEFVIVRKLFEYLEVNKLELILKLDREFLAMSSLEFAKAYTIIGENFLLHLGKLTMQKDICNNYFSHIQTNQLKFSDLALLSVYAYELDITVDDFITLWAKKNLIAIATASLKISKIKPSHIQQMLFEFDDILEKAIQNKTTQISNFNPLFEEIIYKHKYLEPKMFTT